LNNEEFISFKEIIGIFWAKKWWILSISFITAVITMIVSFFLPKTYAAEAILLMPEAATSSTLISSPLGIFSPKLGAGQGLSSQVIKAVLGSKRSLSKVAKKFNLQKVYKKEDMGNTMLVLKERTKIGIFNLTGEMKIQVQDRDPQRAADICNYYISMIDTLNSQLCLTSTKEIAKVLDYASPPKNKSSPRIKLNMLVSFLLAFVIAFSYYVFSSKKY
jgi:uncharacterized protein involved in exopolysaccharide biosynthesis